ncbi:hypothetical protein [Nocardioides pakistanensis]
MTFPDNDLTCHVCSNRGVNAWHITRCEARRAEDQAVVRRAQEQGVSSVKALDLLAHVRSGRTDDPAAIVAVVLDLGWRPVIGGAS